MTFGYWSLCSIGSLYIIAYIPFFILICIQMYQIWGLKLKDKTYNLGPGLNYMLKELQLGIVCMYSPTKSLEEKWSLLSDWKVIRLGFQLTEGENEFQRQWWKLCSDSVVKQCETAFHVDVGIMEPWRKQLFPKLLCFNKGPISPFLLLRDWCCVFL